MTLMTFKIHDKFMQLFILTSQFTRLKINIIYFYMNINNNNNVINTCTYKVVQI